MLKPDIECAVQLLARLRGCAGANFADTAEALKLAMEPLGVYSEKSIGFRPEEAEVLNRFWDALLGLGQRTPEERRQQAAHVFGALLAGKQGGGYFGEWAQETCEAIAASAEIALASCAEIPTRRTLYLVVDNTLSRAG